MQYDSDHQSVDGGNGHLPMLDFDPVFGGESRIDMEMSFTLTEPPPEGPPSRQTIYIADEDSTIRFVGYEAIPWRSLCWNIACVLTVGILALFGHWFPRLWLRWVAQEKAFINSKKGFIVVEVSMDNTFVFCKLTPP
jgi:cation-transporting ATPase 13A3/4/5